MSVSLKVTQFGNGWGAIAKIPDLWKTLMKFYETLPAKMAATYAREMRRAIKSTSMKANSSATIILKGSNEPLVDSGKMRRSIINKKEKKFNYYGGIDPKAVSASGKKISDIALAQNAGYVVPVTESLRSFMASRGITLRADTKVLIVPPRPFLSLAFDKAQPKLQKLLRRTKVDTSRVVRTAFRG